MIIPYMPVPTADPIPSLGGSFTRYRPVKAVLLIGPSGTRLRDALLDTGSDDTVFEEWVAQRLGIDLTNAAERLLSLVGRPQPIRCRYATVRLRLTDGISETFEWEAIVGFAATRPRYSLAGHAGFFQFFDATFRSQTREAEIVPNAAFRGQRLTHRPPRP